MCYLVLSENLWRRRISGANGADMTRHAEIYIQTDSDISLPITEERKRISVCHASSSAPGLIGFVAVIANFEDEKVLRVDLLHSMFRAPKRGR